MASCYFPRGKTIENNRSSKALLDLGVPNYKKTSLSTGEFIVGTMTSYAYENSQILAVGAQFTNLIFG